ncbi:MAG: VTT domain-containing protein [Cytophagaceae bacterium]|nr:VTT domain-containing protein [Cytophagaceae bacterium]
MSKSSIESISEFKPLVFPMLLALLPWLGSGLLVYVIKTYPSIVEGQDLGIQLMGLGILTLGLAAGLVHASMASIAMGYYFGWKGLAIFGIPYLGACVLGYLLCSFLDSGKLNSYLKLMYDKWEVHAQDAIKNPIVYVFFLRLTPVFPFAITNYLLASLRIDFWKMLIASAAGQLPRSALFVWVGTLITNWLTWVGESKTGEFMIWQNMPGNTRYFWFALVGLGLLALFVMWKRADSISKSENITHKE